MKSSIENRTDPRIVTGLSIFAGLGLLPFVMLHLLRADYFMFGIVGSLNLVLFSLALDTYRSGQSRQRDLVLGTAIGSVVIFLAVQELHLIGLLWVYPYLICAYYLLGTRTGTLFAAVFCPAIIISAFFWAGDEALPRIVATIIVNWGCCWVCSYVIDSQRSELARSALRDPLTGLRNRRELQAEMERAIQMQQRYGTTASLIILDVDYFKRVNDQHGHDGGDRVLIELARLLEQSVRQTDHIFRLGGEEFVILAPEGSLDVGIRIAEKMREQVENQVFGGIRGITISLGIAELTGSESSSEWLKRADKALYIAKGRGRNRTEIAVEAMAT